MARRGLNKPIVAEGVQIVGGFGSSVCTPGENNGTLGELVPVRNTIAADWVGIRYYAVNYDGGSDTAAGFSDVSMAAAGAVALKTIEEMLTRLPKLGQGQRAVVAIKARAGGANYLKKDGVTLDRLNLNGIYGYFQLLVRGTGDVPTAGAVAFANDTADKIALGARIVAGTNVAGYNPVAPISVTTFDVQLSGGGAPALAAEPTLVGKRIRFDSATTTVALRNVAAMIHANDTDTITVADDLPAVPVTTDVFYIEEPGLAVEQLAIRSTTPNAQDEAPSFALQGIQVAGVRCTGTGAGAGGVITGSNMCLLSFIDSASTSFTAFSVISFMDVRFQRSYVDATGVTIITGVGCRAPGGINASRGQFLIVASSALVGPGAIGRVQSLNVNQNTVGAGCYFFIGVLIQGGGNGANSIGAVFTTIVGRGSSTTVRRLRILAPVGAPSCGLNVSHGDGTIWGVDITGMGASSAIILRGVNQSYSIQDAVGSTGNTGAAVDLTFALDAHVVMGNITVNTLTGGAGQDVVGVGSVRYVHADYARTDLRDNGGNHVQGTAGSIMGTTTLATNDAVADVGQYKIVRPTASGIVQAAIASAAATAIAAGVAQSPMTAAGSQNAMLANGGGTWIQFDAAPTAGNIAYLSTATAGNAQDTVPAVAGANQKLRLGRVLRVSGTLGFIGWHPESLAVLADGAA